MLVMIAQAVFLLERGQTHRQTRLNALLHAGRGYTAGVGKNLSIEKHTLCLYV